MRFRYLMLPLILIFLSAFVVVQPSVAEAKGKTKTVAKHTKKNKAQSKSVKKAKRASKRKVAPVKRGVQAKAVYCINLRSNQTLIARNPDAQLPIASLTKLVTALVTLDKMPLTCKVLVPDHIKSIPKTVVGLKAGDTVTVKDLLHGLLINSGNDCAETLACGYPHGRSAFISAMNQKVRSMGMKRTKFYTPSGLDLKSGSAPGCEVNSNVSTARELAAVAKEAFENPVIRSICLKRNYIMASDVEKRGYAVRTTNKLLKDNLPLVGGKTGFTCKAGHCLASAFKQGDNAFLIVVLGSPDHFRDTRLVYHKALKETTRLKAKATSAHRRIAAGGIMRSIPN